MVGVFWLASVSGGETVVQKMDAFPLATWENNDQLFWTGAKVGDKMELATKVDAAGKYRLQVVLTKAPDYGIVQFALDGKKVGGQIDVYSKWIGTTPPIPLGDFELTAGKHTLTVTLVGKNQKSKRMNFGIDQVLLTKSPTLPPALPGTKTAPLDELSNLELLPRLRPGERTIMFSSYDRTGGNNDGFSGAYSKLWVEDGNSVLAVMDGPGVVERIYFAYSGRKPGFLDRKGEHIRIYIDGSEKPVVDVPIEEFYRGRLPRFPAPLVGENQGGFYCYVPIPYRNGCKIEVDGTGVRFYQINYTKIPSALPAAIPAAKVEIPSVKTETIAPFSMEMDAQQKSSLERAVKLWTNLGDVASLDMKKPVWTEVDLTLEPGKEQKIALPAGARMVRAVLLEGDKKQLDAARNAKLQFRWDGQEKPAVDLPTEFFFCRAFLKQEYRSLLTGGNDGGWYNFMPMPYRESGQIVVRATDEPISVKLRVATVPLGVDQDLSKLGYFHAAYHENLPTKSNVHYQFLKRDGVGHYLGTYMVTRGKGHGVHKLSLWLEGDPLFSADGNLAMHGTGSEEYFNSGWYSFKGRLDGPGGSPLGGFPVYRIEGDDHLTASYRWHVADPFSYEKQIDAKIEHGPANRTKADYRSSAFYYEMVP